MLIRPTKVVRPAAHGILLLALLLAASCAAQGKKAEEKDTAPKHPVGDLIEATNKQDSIGQLLAEIDLSIQRWNQLSLTGSTHDAQEKARKLELWIQGEAHRRRTEIIEQLESGPLQNRIVSAMALGFTREVEVQSPLLAALEDKDVAVVGNALLGLWLLDRSDTPLDKICTLLRTSSDPTVRSNAALCLMSLTKHGAQNACVREAARLGVLDTEPSVRSHSALVLGNLLDADSLVSLANHLTDPVPIVAMASAKAILHIGQEVMASKGAAARALVKGLEETKGNVDEEIHRCLVQLAGVDYGKDVKDWTEWALRLP